MFGAPVKRCFREQVELIDLAWSRLSNDQKSSVIDMYALYADVMKYWDIPNIKKAAA
jgi:hypothetical protein